YLPSPRHNLDFPRRLDLYHLSSRAFSLTASRFPPPASRLPPSPTASLRPHGPSLRPPVHQHRSSTPSSCDRCTNRSPAPSAAGTPRVDSGPLQARRLSFSRVSRRTSRTPIPDRD